MPASRTFTSLRVTPPDPVALLTNVRTAVGDPVAGVALLGGTYVVKKTTDWMQADISATQAAIDTAPALTPQLAAQRVIDAFPIEFKALVLALIDQLNVIRAALPTPLPAITPVQAIAAIRAKAGTL